MRYYKLYLSAQLSMKPKALVCTNTIDTKNGFSLLVNSPSEVDVFLF